MAYRIPTELWVFTTDELSADEAALDQVHLTAFFTKEAADRFLQHRGGAVPDKGKGRKWRPSISTIRFVAVPGGSASCKDAPESAWFVMDLDNASPNDRIHGRCYVWAFSSRERARRFISQMDPIEHWEDVRVSAPFRLFQSN